MDIELKTILKIIKGDYDFAPAGPIDTKRLIRLSFRHKVVYQMLLFAQKHAELFSAEQLTRLNDRNRVVARQSLIQLQEMKEIGAIFNEKEIGYVCIKGPQLSRMLYGREALKDSVDLDIILTDAKDLQDVHELLTGCGYTQSNLNDYPGKWQRKLFLIAKREVHYHNPEKNLSIDLHIRPGANTYMTESRFTGFLEDLTDYNLEGTRIPVLKDEAYFVYLCYHAALHQFSRLAWLSDIRAYLILRHKNLDFRKVFSLSGERKIDRCVYLALLLVHDYFNEEYTIQLPPKGYSRRIKKLAKRCKNLLARESSYGMKFMGRAGKFIFVMMLLKGLPAKIDWIYGIMVRQIIKMPLVRQG